MVAQAFRQGPEEGPAPRLRYHGGFPFLAPAAMSQLEELRAVVRQFVSERGWDQHHNPKNLAIARPEPAGAEPARFRTG